MRNSPWKDLYQVRERLFPPSAAIFVPGETGRMPNTLVVSTGRAVILSVETQRFEAASLQPYSVTTHCIGGNHTVPKKPRDTGLEETPEPNPTQPPARGRTPLANLHSTHWHTYLHTYLHSPRSERCFFSANPVLWRLPYVSHLRPGNAAARGRRSRLGGSSRARPAPRPALTPVAPRRPPSPRPPRHPHRPPPRPP